MLGLNAMRVTVRSACIKLNIALEWVDRRCSSTDMVVCRYILFKIIFIYAKQKIMDGDGEFDPTTKDQGATGGATGGGDENPQDYKFPDVPSDPSA